MTLTVVVRSRPLLQPSLLSCPRLPGASPIRPLPSSEFDNFVEQNRVLSNLCPAASLYLPVFKRNFPISPLARILI